MSEINVPSQQRDAITALDVGVVRKLVEQSLREERLVGLSDLRLYACGDYIGEKLRIFQQAVLGHAAAKAPLKTSADGDGCSSRRRCVGFGRRADAGQGRARAQRG